MTSFRVLLLSSLLAACGAAPQLDGGVDAGPIDAGTIDGGPFDSGTPEHRLDELARVGGDVSSATTFTFGCAAVPDGSGGLYAALDTDSGLDGPVRGLRDLVIARFTSTGQTVWLRQLGDESMIAPLFTRACALAVDADGNVYAAGLVNGRGDFLGETLPALFTAMVASWAPDGTRRWVKLLGGPGGSEAMEITVTSDEVRVLGYSSGTIESRAGLGNGDVFLARLDAASGSVRDLTLFGGADEDVPAGLTPNALVYRTTMGVLGPLTAITRVPLADDGGIGAPQSLPAGLAHVASLDSALITASTEDTDAGLLIHVRAYDDIGAVTRARELASPPGASLRTFGCGAPGCLLAVREDGGTRLVALDSAFDTQVSTLLQSVDGGAPPVVRAVTTLGSGFIVIGSDGSGTRADAVLWRFTP